MELSLIEAIGGLGVGAVFGLVAFFFYRIDRRASEKRLSGLLKADQETRAQHTAVLTELITYLKAKNGKSKG